MKYRLGDLTVQHWNDWDRVPRMPEVFIAAAASAGVSTATIATVGTYTITAAKIVGYLAYTAVTSWALNALAPKPDFGAAGSSGILVNAKDPAAAQEFVYGETRKGGVITYYETSGDSNKYLHQIVTLAGHEVNSIGDIYLNDEVATINASGFVTSQSWNSKIYIKKFTGTASQNVKSDLDALSNFDGPSLPANFKGQNVACLYVRYEYNKDAFPNGLPLVTAKVQGKKVFDPRDDTTAYSNNAALCIRDFITSAYGLNDSSVDDTSFEAAANTCDEDVTLSGSGTEKRYTINGVISAARAVGDVLGDLTTACAGTLFWGCGEWKLRVGEHTTYVKDLGLADLRGPVTLDTRMSMRDNFNTVRGTFIDAGQGWISVDYPQIASDTFKAEDGGEEVSLDLPLPYTTSAATAQRLAKMTLYRGREQMTLSADFGMKAFDVEVGDIIRFTNSRYGFSNKEFECVGWRLVPDVDQGDLRVNLTLRETSSAAFSWSAEETAIIANNSTLESPYATQTPSLDAPSVAHIINKDGTSIPEITFTWSVTNEELVDVYEFQYKTSGATNYETAIVNQARFVLSPARTNTAYNYRVTAINNLGVRGTQVSGASTVSTGQDATTPNAPTGVTVAGGYQSTTVTWTAPTTNTDASTLDDLFQYEVYRGTSTNPTSLVGVVSGEQFTESGLANATTYYYRVKAVDFTGNKSAYSANGNGTTGAAVQGPTGATGPRGAGRWHIGVTTLPTSSTAAYTAWDNAFTFDPVNLDQAWFYTGTLESPTAQKVWIYDTTQDPDAFVEQVEYVDGNLVIAGTLTSDKIQVDDLSALSANLGDVNIDNTLTLTAGGAGFLGGRTNVSQYSDQGFYIARTLLGDGTKGFEVSHTSVFDGKLSGIIHDNDQQMAVINPKILTGGSSGGGSSNITASANIGAADSLTLTIIGGGGGGGYGKGNGGGSGRAGTGGTTTVKVRANSASGTIIATLTAAGGQGGRNAYFGRGSSEGNGDSTIFGSGGAGGANNSHGNSPAATAYGAGGGGGGGDAPSIFDSSGNMGEGGDAGTLVTQTIDTSSAGTVYLEVTIGAGGLGSTSGDTNGADGATGVVSYQSPLGGTTEVDFDAISKGSFIKGFSYGRSGSASLRNQNTSTIPAPTSGSTKTAWLISWYRSDSENSAGGTIDKTNITSGVSLSGGGPTGSAAQILTNGWAHPDWSTGGTVGVSAQNSRNVVLVHATGTILLKGTHETRSLNFQWQELLN